MTPVLAFPPASEWPTPSALGAIKQPLSPVLPMTPALLPEPYAPWLTDVAERMQCPLDYVAVGAVISTASLIGTGCGIRPKTHDAWTIIPNLWGGIVGAPGALKSPALKEVISPLEALATQALETHGKQFKAFLLDMDVHKATKEALKKGMKATTDPDGARETLKQRLAALQEPPEPTCRRYITNDATVEKMHALLGQNPRGLLLFRDELMGLLESWEKLGHEGERAFYLEAWNGYGAKTMDRIGRGTVHTERLCVSILGSTQPSKVLSYFGRTLEGGDNDGLLQRFQLLVYPDASSHWTLVDRPPNAAARDAAMAIMSTLATMERAPKQFDPQAQELFYTWLTDLERQLRRDDATPLMTEYRAKHRKLVPALALIFHLIEVAHGQGGDTVNAACLERALGWCTYLESHAQRIYTLGQETNYQAAQNLAKKILDKALPSSFDAREVYRKGWSLLKNREAVEAACEVLITHGWLREEPTTSGGKVLHRYQINPRIAE